MVVTNKILQSYGKGRRAKRTEIWDSGVPVERTIRVPLTLMVFNVILKSFRELEIFS